MKLVLVGWFAALISFAIGFVLGRRARRRDQFREAMFTAAVALGTTKMLERISRNAVDPTNQDKS